jgi:hypothetical protein
LSDTIWNNDGTSVAEGTLFEVWTTSGALAGTDADPAQEGFQVAARGGRLRFQVQAGTVALPAQIVARSGVGKAVGRTTLEFTDSSPPAVPTRLIAEWDGQAVLVHWQANEEPDLAGYRIYYQEGRAGPPYAGTAAPPGQPSPIAVGTDTTARVLGLQPGQTYYLVLSAYDILGNESGYSAAAVVDATITAVEEDRGQVLPGEYQLWPNFPNPFNLVGVSAWRRARRQRGRGAAAPWRSGRRKARGAFLSGARARRTGLAERCWCGSSL